MNDWKLLSTLDADFGSGAFGKLADAVWTVFFLVILEEGSWAFLLVGVGLQGTSISTDGSGVESLFYLDNL